MIFCCCCSSIYHEIIGDCLQALLQISRLTVPGFFFFSNRKLDTTKKTRPKIKAVTWFWPSFPRKGKRSEVSSGRPESAQKVLCRPVPYWTAPFGRYEQKIWLAVIVIDLQLSYMQWHSFFPAVYVFFLCLLLDFTDHHYHHRIAKKVL